MAAVAIGLACCVAVVAVLWWRARPSARAAGAGGTAVAGPSGPPPDGTSLVGRPAPPVSGVDLAGTPSGVAWDGEVTVLAFLSSGCLTCRPIWSGLAAGSRPAGARAVVVTPDPGGEDRRRLVELAGGAAAVVMSTQAWLDYRAGAAPWAVVVAAGRVAAAGHPDGWAGLEALVSAGTRGVTG